MNEIDFYFEQEIGNGKFGYICHLEAEPPKDASKEQFDAHFRETLAIARSAVIEDARQAMQGICHNPLPSGNNPNALPAGNLPQNNQMYLPAPSTQNFGKNNGTRAPKPASEKQIYRIKEICQEKRLNPDIVAQEHGVATVEQMSGKDCWHYIDKHTEE